MASKYLDFTGLSRFLDQIKSIFAPKKQGVEYINGTQTASTNVWTGETADNELYEGKMIAYRLPFAGTSSGATLNLTFANGTTSGAKNVYTSTSTRMTTHVSAGNTVILVYHEANVIGSTTYQGWWMDAYYNSDSSAWQMYVYASRGGHTVTDCPGVCIFLTQSETMLLPTWAGTENSTAATHVMTTEEFDPFGHIYYKSSTLYHSGAIIGQALYYQVQVDLRYAFNTNGFDLLDNGVGTTVYMVCEPTANGKAVLHDPAITKTLPIEDDSLLYVYLGRSYSSIGIFLMLDHPVYMFDAEAGEAIAIDRSYLFCRDKNRAIHEIVDPMIPTSVPELGSIITFDDGADGAGLKKCKIEFQATQDLHGYDHPWPAGGGVNKLDIVTVSIAKPAWYTGNWNGITKNVNAGITQERGYNNGGAGGFTVALKPGETYTVSWTYNKSISDDCKVHVTSYNGTELTTILDNVTVKSSTIRFSASFTIPSDSVMVAIRPTAFVATQSGQTYDIDYIQIEEGSTATAWTPYENICPISGYTGVDIARTGVNLWGGSGMADSMVAAVNNQTYCYKGSDSDGDFVALRASSYVDKRFTAMAFKENTQYTLILKIKRLYASGSTNLRFVYTDRTHSDVIIPGTVTANTVYTIAAVSSLNKTVAEVKGAYLSGISCLYYDSCGLFEGVKTVDDFVPYTGTVYPISWQSEAGTLYNFTYDAVTGKIVATHAGVDMGTLDWTYNTSVDRIYKAIVPGIKETIEYADRRKGFICDRYPISETIAINETMADKSLLKAGHDIVVRDTAFDTKEAVKSAMNGVQLVYELAEPIEIQLTPPGITTLKGLNNIFTDCGEITEFEYYRDTQALDAVDSKYVSATTNQQFTPNQQLQARENIGATGIEWIQSTQTGTTGNWTGVSRDTALYDGKIICYRLSHSGSGNASLNLTLANGDETGPIPVYWHSTTRVTTHQAAGAEWLYVYHEDYISPVDNSHKGPGWWSLNRAYYTDSYPSYSCREYTSPRTKTYLYRYMLCFSDVDKKLVPANNVSNSTATTKTLTTESFDPFGAIYYYGATPAIADNGAPGENLLYYTINTFDLRYSFNTGSTLTSRQPVYVVCEPQDDGRVKLAENPIVQTIPLEDNGLIYIYLGEARSTSAVCLSAYHDIYKVYNGAVYNIKALMLN